MKQDFINLWLLLTAIISGLVLIRHKYHDPEKGEKGWLDVIVVPISILLAGAYTLIPAWVLVDIAHTLDFL